VWIEVLAGGDIAASGDKEVKVISPTEMNLMLSIPDKYYTCLQEHASTKTRINVLCPWSLKLHLLYAA
jgi:hypothetical protein